MAITLKPLARQTIVITGGTSGNGLATAEAAVAAGANVVIAARNEAALAQVKERLGPRVATVAADVADRAQVDRIADTAIAAFGGFDSWVNNAAAATYGAMEEVPEADHRRIFDVNVDGDPKAGSAIWYLVMEFVSGQTAGRLIKDRMKGGRGPLPEGDALDILLTVSDGLAAAHEQKFIHRDIKPDNIIIPAGPDGGSVPRSARSPW